MKAVEAASGSSNVLNPKPYVFLGIKVIKAFTGRLGLLGLKLLAGVAVLIGITGLKV